MNDWQTIKSTVSDKLGSGDQLLGDYKQEIEQIIAV